MGKTVFILRQGPGAYGTLGPSKSNVALKNLPVGPLDLLKIGEYTLHFYGGILQNFIEALDSGLRTGLFNTKLHLEILHQDYIVKQY